MKTSHYPTQEDALARVAGDQRSIERLFGAWDLLRGRVDSQAEQAAIAQRVVLELDVHMQVVERLFYPALQRTRDADDGLAVERAWTELALLAELREQLAALTPRDELFDGTMQLLGHLQRRHAQHERDCLFPLARRMAIDLVGLGQRMSTESERLLAQAAERGLAQDDEADDPVGRPVQALEA
jgi:hypothetical protein